MTNVTETRELTSADLDQVVGAGDVPPVVEIIVTKDQDSSSASGLSGGKVSVSSFNFMKKMD